MVYIRYKLNLMKNLIALSLLLTFIFTACKKDRVCSCTITKTGTSTTHGSVGIAIIPGFATSVVDTSFSTNVFEIQMVDKKLEKVSKRQAKSNCISYTEPYSESIPTTIPTSTFNLSVVVINKGEKHYACDLK